MQPYYEKNGITIYHGDCREVLPSIRGVECCITDPPYHLTAGKKGGTGQASVNLESPYGRSRITTGFMGKAWDGGDVAFRVETWQAVLASLLPGAFLLAFGGTRTYHRMTCAIEDAGFEIRDCMQWLYGSGFPKSLDISKAIDKAAGEQREVVATRKKRGLGGSSTFAQDAWTQSQRGVIDLPVTAPATEAAKLWHGHGTALKPAYEPIVVAMKPLDGTFAENAQKHGVAGLNIDAGRIPLNGDYKCGANGRPSQTGLGDNYDPSKANQHSEVGRWPANVILDEVAAEQLDQQSGERRAGGAPRSRKSPKTQNTFGQFGMECPHGQSSSGGGASRFFYCAKASKKERGEFNTHPTVKPLSLLEYLCKLTQSPSDGVLLDLFAGSGSTLLAAQRTGRRAIGIELEESHCEIAAKRLEQQPRTFAEAS